MIGTLAIFRNICQIIGLKKLETVETVKVRVYPECIPVSSLYLVKKGKDAIR